MAGFFDNIGGLLGGGATTAGAGAAAAGAATGAMSAVPIIGAGLGVLQTGLGIAKSIKANKLRKKAQSFFESNQYAIPESATAALGVAQKQASGVSLPGESAIRARLGETTATGVQQAQNVGTSSADVLSSMAGLYGNQQRQETGLGIQAANRYDVNQRYLGQALNNMAGYEDKKWQYNVLYPYQQMLGQAGQLGGQANQEISGGVGQIASAGSAWMQSQAMQNKVKTAENQIGLNNRAYTPIASMQMRSGQPVSALQPQIVSPESSPDQSGSYSWSPYNY